MASAGNVQVTRLTPRDRELARRLFATMAEVFGQRSEWLSDDYLDRLLTRTEVVASALGHADARMTEQHYAHLAPSHVAQLIRDNLPQLGATPSKKPRKVTRLRV
jgi:integrase